ncbi:MAG: hypothetical protein EP330_24870 [Deltaproteobacteria bacterium]|nr:MAG: hypothetical protein EP330_24870 [Deltaproteobacteria bacterium]
MNLLLTLLIASATADELQPTEPEPVLWAGRMAVFGERKLPFIGTVEFRNDNYTLAEVVETENGYALQQRVCKVAFEKVAGAQASMDEKGPRAMPVAEPVFVRGEAGYAAQPWPSGWDASDHDADGFPGIAVRVSAPLCGGTMHFASDASTIAVAQPHHGGLKGLATIRVSQQVHKVQGACLALVTKDVTQDLRGQFVYLPVPADTTCDSVPDEAWPDPTTLDLTALSAPSLPHPDDEEQAAAGGSPGPSTP